jgi:hypothetical protein
MIREFENSILVKMNFCNKFLKIHQKFYKNETDTPTINKSEVLKILKDLGYHFVYKNGGYYFYDKIYNKYKFQLYFNIKYNIPLTYMVIYENGIIQETGITQFGSILRYLPYDETLINNNFGLNSIKEMKEYLKENIDLFNEFLDEYIKEIDEGNTP